MSRYSTQRRFEGPFPLPFPLRAFWLFPLFCAPFGECVESTWETFRFCVSAGATAAAMTVPGALDGPAALEEAWDGKPKPMPTGRVVLLVVVCRAGGVGLGSSCLRAIPRMTRLPLS